MERKGDRRTHIETLFEFIRDTVKEKDVRNVYFAAGYYACLSNEGDIPDAAMPVFNKLFETIEKRIGVNKKTTPVDTLLDHTINELEKAVLKGDETK